MRRSLRVRLLFWYAIIVTLLIIAFCGTVSYLYWRSLLAGIDRELSAHAAEIARALHHGPSGFFDLDLPAQYREAEFVNRTPYTYYIVRDSTNELIDRSDAYIGLGPGRPAETTRRRVREFVLRTADGATILVGRDLSEDYRDVERLATTVGSVGLGVLVFSLGGGWFLTGRALAPISRINRTAREMAKGDLSARIVVEQTENELEHVARALNDAFDQLRLAAEIQRRFIADASHELRTPLATLRAKVDWALTRPRDNADYVNALETCRRATARMSGTVEELVTLATEESVTEPRREDVELSSIVSDAVTFLEPLATERGVIIDTELMKVYVTGDPGRLSDAVANLLKNAIEYNRVNGRVSVAAWKQGSSAFVRVKDTGIGIADEDLPNIFERFYRADKARTRPSGGAGLGLSIVKRIVDDHQGTISTSSHLGEGTEVVVRLPAILDEIAPLAAS